MRRFCVAALLLSLLLTALSGCRREAPSAPARGWARLDALLALHPSQGMVTDLDRRLARLTQQRADLLDAPAPPLPPDYLEHATPPLAALPASDPPRTPAPASTSALSDQEMADYEARMHARADRRLTRREWALRAETAQRCREEQEEIQRMADDKQMVLGRIYRSAVPNVMPPELLEQQYREARQQADEMRAQREKAEANVQQQQHAVAGARYDHRAKERLTDAETRLAQARDRETRYEAAANAAHQRWRDLTGKLKANDETYNKTLARLHKEAASLKAQAEQVRDDDYAAGMRQARDEEQTAVAKQLVQKRELLREPLTAQPSTPPTALTFPAQPGGKVALATMHVRAAIGQAHFGALQQRLAAARVLDETIAALTRQRAAICADIARDTRLAALSVAAQHEVTLVLDAPNGTEMTAHVRAWLRDYWPAPATATQQ